jgi:SSS family solute:Na+ symporter
VVGIPFTIISLYALAKLGPEFFPAQAKPTAAWTVMARFLPDGVAGLIFVSALAASVSTSSTAILGAVSTASRDVYQRVFNPKASLRELLIVSRILTLVFGIAVLALCFYPGGPVFLFAFGFAFMVPPGLILFIAMAWRKLTPTAGFVSMLVGMISIIVWQLSPSLMKLGHQVWIGVVLTPVTAILLSYVTERKYYNEAS